MLAVWAFALAQALLAVCALADGLDPLDVASYVRRDSARYLHIANRGYVEDPSDIHKGNAGWFPGYPLAVRALKAATGWRAPAAGRVVALASLAGLLVLLGAALPEVDEERRALAVLAAAFFPGSVYFSAVFPVSLCALLGLAAALLASRDKDVAAGSCLALAAFSYPTGALHAVGLVVGARLRPGLTPGRRLLAAAGPVLAAGLGLSVVLAWHSVVLGHWDAFFAYQRQFGHRLSNPLATFWTHVAPLWSAPGFSARVEALQALATLSLLLAAAGLLARDRRQARPLDAMLLANAACLWLFPLSLGPRVSSYRADALLVGVVPLLARLPARRLLTVVVLLVILAGGMAGLFFDGELI